MAERCVRSASAVGLTVALGGDRAGRGIGVPAWARRLWLRSPAPDPSHDPARGGRRNLRPQPASGVLPASPPACCLIAQSLVLDSRAPATGQLHRTLPSAREALLAGRGLWPNLIVIGTSFRPFTGHEFLRPGAAARAAPGGRARGLLARTPRSKPSMGPRARFPARPSSGFRGAQCLRTPFRALGPLPSDTLLKKPGEVWFPSPDILLPAYDRVGRRPRGMRAVLVPRAPAHWHPLELQALPRRAKPSG